MGFDSATKYLNESKNYKKLFNLELGESSRELNDEIYDENDEIITDDGIDLT